MKKFDIILIGIICAIAAVLSLGLWIFKSEGKTLVVKENNSIVAKYPLNTDRQVELAGNTFVIKSGTVYMSSADCKNQICVKTGKISKRGECIVCLPNRVILTIE